MSSQIKSFLALSFFTMLASSVCSIAGFFSIDAVFHNINFLAWALSARMLCSALFSYKANWLIDRIGVKKSYFLAQYFAILSGASLFLGFYLHSFLIIFISISVIGLPLNLTNILLTISFRNMVASEELFRKFSGKRELYSGLARFLACVFAPLLLLYLKLNWILLLYVFFCIVSVVFLTLLDLQQSNNKVENETVKFNYEVFKFPETWQFIFKLAPAYLLVAFIALIASSQDLSFTQNISTVLRQSLWSLEALTMIIGSSIYVYTKRIKDFRVFDILLMLNAFPLFLLFFNDSLFSLVIVILSVSLFVMFSFYKFRDDYVLSANNNQQLIEIYSGFSLMCRDFIACTSPLLITFIFHHFSYVHSIVLLMGIQVALLFVHELLKFFNKQKHIIL